MDIEVATPERQAELDGMDVSQLEALVSQEEGAAPVDQQATTQPKGEAVSSEKGSETNQETPKPDAEPAWFTKFKEENKRELGSFRSLASLKDQLPSLIQRELNQRLASLQQAQNRANLSPEDQQAQDQLQTQQELLQRFVDERADARAKAQLQALAGNYLPLLNELKEQRSDERLKNGISEVLSDFIPDLTKESFDEKFNLLFEGLAEKIEAGDQAALSRFDRLTKDPSFAALEIIRSQRSQVQQQAEKVTQKRTQAAQQAAQGVKTSAVQAGGKKSVAEMSQAELDAMSIEDLEKAIPQA